MEQTLPAITIDMYADIVCPWCYIGEARLKKALGQRPDLTVKLRWQPFQLRPDMPVTGLDWRSFAEGKFGGWEAARQMFVHVTAIGASEGVTLRYDRVASAPNTADAHRLILLAAQEDKQWEMVRLLFRAYFEEGGNLNNLHYLAQLAASVLSQPYESVLAYLESEEGRAQVSSAQEAAHAFGITGVPFFVIQGRFGISGAQPLDVFLKGLELASQSFEATLLP